MSFFYRLIGFLKKRILIKKLNRHLYVSKSAHLDFQGDVSLEKGVTLSEGVLIQVPINGNLNLGRGVFVGKDSEISPGGHISIGAGSSIQVRSILLGNISMGGGCVCAPNLYVSSGEHHFKDYPELPIKIQDAIAREIAKDSDDGLVTIGDDCWLGINVVIMRGVTIGKGCVIGANSVVTHDILPYSVAVGSPAKVIKKRLEFNPPEYIDASDNACLPYFYSGFDIFGERSLDGSITQFNGGYLVGESFVISLGIENGDEFALEIFSTAEGELLCGDMIRKIMLGNSKIEFRNVKNVDCFLKFKTKFLSPGKLALIRAYKID